MSNDKLGMIAFGKVKTLEKRIKLIEEELYDLKRDTVGHEAPWFSTNKASTS